MERKRLRQSVSRILAAALLAAAAPVLAQSSSMYPADPGSQGTTQVVWIPAGQVVTVVARSTSDSIIDLRVEGRAGMLGEEQGCESCVVQFVSATSQEVRIVATGAAQITVNCLGCVSRQPGWPGGPVPGLPRLPWLR